jgi:hypothetical protein
MNKIALTGWGVLDTNQAARLPNFTALTGTNQIRKRLTLPPLVLAEILLRHNPAPTLERLRQYEVRFGTELRPAFEEFISGARFHPFVQDFPRLKFLVSALEGPTDRHRSWALEQKTAVRDYLRTMATAFENWRRRSRASEIEHERLRQIQLARGDERVRDSERKRRPTKYKTLDEAINDDLLSFRSTVLYVFTDGRSKQSPAKDAALFERIMAEPCLRRFWRAFLYCQVSWGRQWQDQKRNFDPTPNRDDMTDLQLLLYAEDGDTIITADKLLPMMLPEVEPSGVIKVCTAEKF